MPRRTKSPDEKYVTVAVKQDLHRALRMLAAQRDSTIQQIVTDTLQTIVKEQDDRKDTTQA